VLETIRDADAIVLGPGSLYTSILPNLLVAGVAAAVAESNAVKMYICNVMTQPGETDDFTASSHVRTLLEQAGRRVCDYVIVNEEPPRRLLEAYAVEGQTPVDPDRAALEALGVRTSSAKRRRSATIRSDSRKSCSNSSTSTSSRVPRSYDLPPEAMRLVTR
jgi:uncharacterized cofD-like protein